MRDFLKEQPYDGRPILLAGKGPSFDKIREANLLDYNVFTLNHAVLSTPCDYAHIIDYDVIKDCEEAIYNNAEFLVMPYYPHFGFRSHPELNIEKLIESNPLIKKMNDEDRLLCYNLATYSPPQVGDSPRVKAKYYSAEAVVNLASLWGAKTIRTVGIDGGSNQSPSFSNLPNLNKERGYDLQWKGIQESIKTFKLDYAPLGTESPIRIFIGAGDAQLVPALVLKHSILKHATMSVDVTIMNEWEHPMPKDKKNWPRTPFSFQRFMIPEKCNYSGSAIYMDSDMLVFGDVKEIWQAPLGNWPVLVMRDKDTDKHRAQGSVIKMDCSRSFINGIASIIEGLDNGDHTYEQLVFDAWPHWGWNPNWNSLEEYTEGKTKLLHYTEMYNQPWLVNPNHPLGHLWFNALTDSVKDGMVDKKLVEDHVMRGWLLPKCLETLCGIVPAAKTM